ncbi:MAG: hypothetical protein ACFFDT_35060 [Candidatus Hodarchaeota archaeon]
MVKSYTDMLLPPFAKYLKKYGQWELSDVGGSLLIPKEEYHFNYLLAKPKQLWVSADRSWQFIAAINILEKNKFSDKDIPLFQQLKGHECQISRIGFIRKKFQFISNPLLKHLEVEIPNLVIDNTLVEILNQDDSLQKSFSTITPDSLSITLFSQPIVTRDLKEYCLQFLNLFQNPTELIWNVNLEKYLGAITSKGKYYKVLDTIIEVLDAISLHIRRNTDIQEKRV